MVSKITPLQQSRLFAGVVFFLSFLAFLAAFGKDKEVGPELGGLIIWVAIIEFVHGFRRSSADQRQLAWKSAAVSLFIGILLINAPLLITGAMAIFIAISFLVDAIIYIRHAIRETEPQKRKKDWLAASGNIGVFLFILLFQKKSLHMALSIGIALRFIGTALNILSAKTGKLDQ